jgi:hypothetical protein
MASKSHEEIADMYGAAADAYKAAGKLAGDATKFRAAFAEAQRLSALADAAAAAEREAEAARLNAGASQASPTWRSAGDMPEEGDLVLVRLRPDLSMKPLWPDTKLVLAAAVVQRKDLDVVYCFANNLCTIPGRFVITGWMPMAEAMLALSK